VLSVFKDGIGYAFYWFIKVSMICFLIKIFFSESKIKIYHSSGRR